MPAVRVHVGTPVGCCLCTDGCQCDWLCVRLTVGNCKSMCEPVYVGVWRLSASLGVTVVCVIQLWCPLTLLTKTSAPGG